jgi:hypothetical protein
VGEAAARRRASKFYVMVELIYSSTLWYGMVRQPSYLLPLGRNRWRCDQVVASGRPGVG